MPAVTLTGPRQSGKSTLCRMLFPDLAYSNLEAPDLREFALNDPRAFLDSFPDGAILDEVQRVPDLPSYLQGLIDANPSPGRWILTGSHNFSLLESVSQSLAGRTEILHLLPLVRGEVIRFDGHPATLDETLLAGGYPRIFDQNLSPADWLRSYVATYIERDVRQIINIGDLSTFQRFVELCAGRTAQLINYSSLAADCGITQPTAKQWLSILETSFVVFRVPAFAANLRKRLVKMPKLHFYDSGLACWLLGIRTVEQLRNHPLRGSIFESWVASEIVKIHENSGERPRISHYRDQSQVEAGLIVEIANEFKVIEVRASQTAKSHLFDSLRKPVANLSEVRTTDGFVVYGGDTPQARSGGDLVPWSSLDQMPWVSELKRPEQG